MSGRVEQLRGSGSSSDRSKRHRVEYVHEAGYVAKVDAELLEDETNGLRTCRWKPRTSLTMYTTR